MRPETKPKMSDGKEIGVGSPSAPQSGPTFAANLQWTGRFAMHDPDPADDHSPVYLACPNGLLVNFSCDPTPGLDVRRVQWIADELNRAAGEGRSALASEIESEDDLIDFVEGSIDNSMDYDWRCRDGAKSVAKDLLAANAVRFADDPLLDVLQWAKVVMDYLGEHGPKVVPHLMDTDDNPGQRLREAIARAEGRSQ